MVFIQKKLHQITRKTTLEKNKILDNVKTDSKGKIPDKKTTVEKK